MTKSSKNKGPPRSSCGSCSIVRTEADGRAGQMPVLKSSTKSSSRSTRTTRSISSRSRPRGRARRRRSGRRSTRSSRPRCQGVHRTETVQQALTTQRSRLTASSSSTSSTGLARAQRCGAAPRRPDGPGEQAQGHARGVHVPRARVSPLRARRPLPDRACVPDQPLPLVDRPRAAEPVHRARQLRHALHDPIFWRALVNTGVYMAVTVPTQIVLGLVVAVLLDARMPARAVFRVLFYLPVVTSWVVVSLLFQYLFITDGGLVNWSCTTRCTSSATTSTGSASAGPAMVVIWHAGHLEGRRLVDDDLPRRAAGRAAGAARSGRRRRRRPWRALPRRLAAGDPAGGRVRDGHARDRRLQRLHLGLADDRRRAARRRPRCCSPTCTSRRSRSSTSATGRRSRSC